MFLLQLNRSFHRGNEGGASLFKRRLIFPSGGLITPSGLRRHQSVKQCMTENSGSFSAVMANRDGIRNIFIHYEISERGSFGKPHREIAPKLIAQILSVHVWMRMCLGTTPHITQLEARCFVVNQIYECLHFLYRPR